MTQAFLPNDNYLLISLEELETALRFLAAPEKLQHVSDIVQSVRVLNREAGPDKALFTMISATAWLTDDSSVSVGELGSRFG